jgi:hypothetical protein
MERRQPPLRGFTPAEAVELFRRISAANDDGESARDPPRPGGPHFRPPGRLATETPPSAA